MKCVCSSVKESYGRRGGEAWRDLGEMGFQAFLTVKDKFGVNRLKSRTFYFKRFRIQRCINGVGWGGRILGSFTFLVTHTHGVTFQHRTDF